MTRHFAITRNGDQSWWSPSSRRIVDTDAIESGDGGLQVPNAREVDCADLTFGRSVAAGLGALQYTATFSATESVAANRISDTKPFLQARCACLIDASVRRVVSTAKDFRCVT